MTMQNRGLMITLGALLLIALIGPALGWGMMRGSAVGWSMMGPGMMAPGMMGGYVGTSSNAGSWTWGVAMLLGWLATIAFWGALILAAFLLLRWLGSTSPSVPSGGRAAGETRGEEPLDILRRRYAAGNLSKDEFEQMRQTLERSGAPA